MKEPAVLIPSNEFLYKLPPLPVLTATPSTSDGYIWQWKHVLKSYIYIKFLIFCNVTKSTAFYKESMLVMGLDGTFHPTYDRRLHGKVKKHKFTKTRYFSDS